MATGTGLASRSRAEVTTMLTLTGRAVGNGLALSCHTGNEWVGQAVAAPLRLLYHAARSLRLLKQNRAECLSDVRATGGLLDSARVVEY